VAIPRALSPGNSATDDNSAVTKSPPPGTRDPISAPLVDDATLLREYQQVRGKISQFQQDWSTSPPAVNSLDSDIPGLRAELEKLTERIEQSGP
jgi:hypothetical protein